MSKTHKSAAALVADAAKFLGEDKVTAAREAARRALTLEKDNPAALNLLGVSEGRLGQNETAIKHLRRLVELQPQSADAHFNLGVVLHQHEDWDRAEFHYGKALQLRPNHAPYFNNLGTLYQSRKQIGPARQFYEAAITHDPSHENATINLYGVYRTLGAMDALEKLTAQTVARWPDNSIHHVARSEALFAQGHIAEAWDAYAWRFKSSQRQEAATSRAVQGIPDWNSEDLKGKTLLVWTEQGVGDEILYATYLNEIRPLVGRLVLLCSRRMAPLFERTFPGVEVYGFKVPQNVLDAVDFQSSIITFAKILRPDLRSFARVPFALLPEAEKRDKLRAKYLNGTNNLLVGISWRSSGVQYADYKTVGLEFWGALFAVPGVTFVNLQYGDAAHEIQQIKAAYGAAVVNDTTIDSLAHLDAYAAQVAAMDVVVSSSNTAAHFGGALGVPTHCLIPATVGYGRRWYWFEKDGGCAWYPSMTIHVQRNPGTWIDVIRDATLSVAKLSFAHGHQKHGHQKEVGAFLVQLAKTYADASDLESAKLVFESLATLPGYELFGLFELARIAKETKQPDQAEQYFDRALQHDPNSAAALNMKGMALAAREQYTDAEAHYLRSIAAAPQGVEAYNNLATVLRRVGRSAEAVELYAAAHERNPAHPSILLNYASSLNENGFSHEAIPYFEKLIQIDPQFPEAHHGYAFALLSAGRFAEGWRELRWRHETAENRNSPHTSQRPPVDLLAVWDSQPLDGANVLVWTEQGLGDEILAMSMLGNLIDAAANVTLLCSVRLVPLFASAFPGATVLPYAALPKLILGNYDFQMSLSELGQAFRAHAASFADAKPYLKAAEDACVRLWAKYRTEKTNNENTNRVVGVSWASANRELAGLKGIGLRQIVEGLLPLPDTKMVNLQYGDHGPEIAVVAEATGITVVQDPDVDSILNFEMFVAQVAAMDVVVTISNTTAHVAGALGIPTLLLLPFGRGRHWYWLRSFENCPWYPSVRYFKQDPDGSWVGALAACRAALNELTSKTSQAGAA